MQRHRRRLKCSRRSFECERRSRERERRSLNFFSGDCNPAGGTWNQAGGSCSDSGGDKSENGELSERRHFFLRVHRVGRESPHPLPRSNPVLAPFLRSLRAFLSQRGAGLFWQMSDRLFLFRRGRSLFDILTRGGFLFWCAHGWATVSLICHRSTRSFRM